MRTRSADPELERRSEAPILVVSSGRAGSTLFHELLSLHPDLAWFPERLLRTPNSDLARVRALMRCLSAPLVSQLLRRALPPGEVYALWERIAPGFSDPRRDLTGDDVTPEIDAGVRAAFRSITTRHRRRVLAKITGWPRIGFLQRCFVDAHFVHVARDPRPVAVSFLRVPWWRGDFGPAAWHWGALSTEDEETWTRHGRSRLALSCIQMQIFWRALSAAATAPGAPRLRHVRYDELCARPVAVMVAVADACGLQRSARFERALGRERIDSRDAAWHTQVSSTERTMIDEILAPCVERFEAITRAVES